MPYCIILSGCFVKGRSRGLAQSAETDTMPEQARSGTFSRLILWLILLSLGVLFLTLFLVSTAIKQDIPALETQFASLQKTLASTPRVPPEEQTMTANLLQLQEQAQILKTAADGLSVQHIDWPAAMGAIAAYDPSRMGVTGLSQTERLVVINGQASDEAVVIDYADSLRQSEQFHQVTVQSITLQTLPTASPLPTPTPAATNDPAAPTLEPPTPAPPVKMVAFVILVELKAS